MHREATTIDIATPVADVFAFVADFDNDPQWRSEVSDSRRVSGTPSEVGAGYEQTLNVTGRDIRIGFGVTEFVPPHIVSFEGASGSVEVDGSIVLTPMADDATRLTFQRSVSGPWWFRAMSPWLARRRERGIERDLEQLKALLEAKSSP